MTEGGLSPQPSPWYIYQMFGRKKPAKIYPDPAKNKNCTEFEVDNWIVSEFVVDRLLPVIGHHPYPLPELTLIAGTVAYFKPKLICEWGTHIGKASRAFYEICQGFNIDAEIHTIDLPDEVEHVEHPHESRGLLIKDIPSIRQHLGDGVDTAVKIYSDNGKPIPALFFVDGDHSYETVKRELTTILQRVEKPIILAHDTFYQSRQAEYNIGPFQAINDIFGERKEFTILSTKIGLPGMSLIYPRN